MKRFAIAAVAALALVGTAQAQKSNAQKSNAQAQMTQAPTHSPFYGEVGLTLLDLAYGGIAGDATALRVLGGYDLDKLIPIPADVPVKLAAEAMLSVGATEATESYSGGNFKAKLDYSLGAYAKAKFIIPPVPKLEPYVRLGLAQTRISFTDAYDYGWGSYSVNGSHTTTGIAYGAGAKFHFTPRISVSVDYMDYGDGIDGITASFGYRF